MSRDALFARCIYLLVTVLILYGFGMVVAVLFGESSLASKMITGFSSMFAGILGLVVGYVVGGRSE